MSADRKRKPESDRRTASDESYGAFAFAYDQALGEPFFTAARRVLTAALEKYPASEKTHLDLACGTGLAIEYFEKNGFTSTGIDASLAMLAVANRRAGRLVAGDLRALPFRGTFARITCLYDSLNHMLTLEDLTEVFRNVRSVMNESSLFFFDMNHPEIYPAVWGMREPYVSTGKDHHLEIATSFRKRERMGHALVTGWATSLRGGRTRIHERHRQKAWSEEEILDALASASLGPVEIETFDPFQEVENVAAEAVKLFFVCRAE